MSSKSFGKPEFRLDLGYPDITLTCDGAEAPLATATPGAPAFPAELRRLAFEVNRARGRLTVVLPEAEVWRGRLALPGRTPFARRRAARAAVAARLALPPREVAVVLGRRTNGVTPVAAAPGVTLAEARRMLVGAGLRPAALVGGGDFPGFTTPPRFAGPWLRPFRGVALGAVLAAVTLATPRPDPAPTPHSLAAPPQAEVAALAPPPEPLGPARAAPPPARPVARLPLATLATRNLPLASADPRRVAPAGLRLAELTTARARFDGLMTPVSRPVRAAPGLGLRPMRRPASTTRAPAPVTGGPRPRPAAPAAVASLESARTAASLAIAVAPLARPAAAAPARTEPRPVAQPARTFAAQPVRRAQPAVARPAAQAVARRAAAQPQVVRRVETRRAATAQRTTPGFALASARRSGSRGVSLVGVFGNADGRHALVRLPNGRIERVRVGDRIQGAQVAAVGADSVQLRGGGRATLLTLPE